MNALHRIRDSIIHSDWLEVNGGAPKLITDIEWISSNYANWLNSFEQISKWILVCSSNNWTLNICKCVVILSNVKHFEIYDHRCCECIHKKYMYTNNIQFERHSSIKFCLCFSCHRRCYLKWVHRHQWQTQKKKKQNCIHKPHNKAKLKETTKGIESEKWTKKQTRHRETRACALP